MNAVMPNHWIIIVSIKMCDVATCALCNFVQVVMERGLVALRQWKMFRIPRISQERGTPNWVKNFVHQWRFPQKQWKLSRASNVCDSLAFFFEKKSIFWFLAWCLRYCIYDWNGSHSKRLNCWMQSKLKGRHKPFKRWVLAMWLHREFVTIFILNGGQISWSMSILKKKLLKTLSMTG